MGTVMTIERVIDNAPTEHLFFNSALTYYRLSTKGFIGNFKGFLDDLKEAVGYQHQTDSMFFDVQTKQWYFDDEVAKTVLNWTQTNKENIEYDDIVWLLPAAWVGTETDPSNLKVEVIKGKVASVVLNYLQGKIKDWELAKLSKKFSNNVDFQTEPPKSETESNTTYEKKSFTYEKFNEFKSKFSIGDEQQFVGDKTKTKTESKPKDEPKPKQPRPDAKFSFDDFGYIGASPELDFLKFLLTEGNLPNETKLEIVKSAYRIASKALHPDKGGDAALFSMLASKYKSLNP